MKILAAMAVVLLVMASALMAYTPTLTRDQMYSIYMTKIDPRIPGWARSMVGTMGVNVYFEGGFVIGAKATNGHLSYFEFTALPSPDVRVYVSDTAASKIAAKQEGPLAAYNKGEITYTTANSAAARKMTTIKWLWGALNIDQYFLSP